MLVFLLVPSVIATLQAYTQLPFFKEAILYISYFMYLGLSYVIEHVINGAIMVEGFWTLDTGLVYRITFFYSHSLSIKLFKIVMHNDYHFSPGKLIKCTK